MWIVYGLGNPGNQYLLTRHNIGWMVVDLLAQEWRIEITKKKAGLIHGNGSINGVPVTLAKPLTYMNLSGQPLRSLSIRPNDLIVVHDDLDIPFGQVRVKKGGGNGGHRGLSSIMAELGGGDFLRIRCGIDRPPGFLEASHYVLQRFETAEQDILTDELARAAEAVRVCLRESPTKAMNIFNRRSAEPEKAE